MRRRRGPEPPGIGGPDRSSRGLDALMERRLIAQLVADAGVGCPLCGRRTTDASGASLCHRCRRELCPTPLELVLDAAGFTIREFAELTGIPERTVRRAARGARVSRRVAVRLAKVTGFAPEAFRPPDDAEGDDGD